MAGWIDEMLKEWRERSTALAPCDHAPPFDEAGPPPAHALDLLRTHVARSGVKIALSDPADGPLPSDRRIAERRAVDAGARPTIHEGSANADAGLARFGRRRSSASAEGATERLARLPQDAVRTPADTRRAVQAFRAAAYGEVEMLRADVARLKEALADLLVENRSLKRKLGPPPDVEAG